MNNKVVSPCISICKTDPVTEYCYGCARTNEEKILWKDKNTTDKWKTTNLIVIQKRMNTSMLKNFKESYEFKIKNGISLIKKKKLDEQK